MNLDVSRLYAEQQRAYFVVRSPSLQCGIADKVLAHFPANEFRHEKAEQYDQLLTPLSRILRSDRLHEETPRDEIASSATRFAADLVSVASTSRL